MNAPAVVREHRNQLAQISGMANADVSNLVYALRSESVERTRDILIEVLPDLILPYESAASELAAVAYEDLRAASGRRGTFYAETAPAAFTGARAEGTVRWAVGALVDDDLTSTLYTRLAGSSMRAIFDASRDTMELNGSRQQSVRFQRMARPDACAFCGMLASRPPYMAYRSEETGLAGSHDDCRCVVMPLYPGSEMAQLAQVERERWEEKYRQSLTDENGRRLSSPQDILAEWRRQHGTH